MQLGENLFSGGWWWLITAFYLLALGLAFRLAPWRWLRNNELMHVFLGASVALILLWGFRLLRGYDEGELPLEAYTPGMTTEAPPVEEEPKPRSKPAPDVSQSTE